MNRWLEASDVLDGHVVGLGRAGAEVLVQGGKDLGIQHLEATDAVHHALQLLEQAMAIHTCTYAH